MLTKKLRAWLALDLRTILLFIEAFYFLALAKLQLKQAFARVAPTLGTQTAETALHGDKRHDPTLKQIRSSLSIMSRHTFWESKCLVQAVAGMRMLERRSIPSTLYLGTSKDDNGKLIAHAWLRSGSIYISGSEGMRRYSVVEKFANHSK